MACAHEALEVHELSALVDLVWSTENPAGIL